MSKVQVEAHPGWDCAASFVLLSATVTSLGAWERYENRPGSTANKDDNRGSSKNVNMGSRGSNKENNGRNKGGNIRPNKGKNQNPSPNGGIRAGHIRASQ